MTPKVPLLKFEEAQRRRVAEIVRRDRHAPCWHFIPPEGKVVSFDPNGALYWRGRYHLFYLYQDDAYRCGTAFHQRGHCWGHASSPDLLHWTYHPAALVPNPGDPEHAIYSGCALINAEGVPTLVYHGYGAGTCIATAADDDLITWTKSPHNPVIVEPREGEPGWGVYNVFDPHVWREGHEYRAILGGQVKPHDRGDTAYLFTSPVLVHWTYQRPFYQPNPAWTTDGDDCACPDFFPLGDRHALLCISHATGARCYLGDYRDGVFTPQSHHRMNWPGGACFAPESLLDGASRRLMWAWAMDQRRYAWDDGEVGVLTMPRVLSQERGELRVTPPVELERLRRAHLEIGPIMLPDGAERTLDFAGDSLEIDLTVYTEGAVTLGVRVSLDGTEQTLIRYDAAEGELAIDVSRSTLATDNYRPHPLDFWRGLPAKNVTVQRVPLQPTPGTPLRLRAFLDRSILEVFANDHLCLTQRLYPTRDDSRHLTLRADGTPAEVEQLDVWELRGVG